MVRFLWVTFILAFTFLSGCGRAGAPSPSVPMIEFEISLEPPGKDQPQISEPEEDYSKNPDEIPHEESPDNIPNTAATSTSTTSSTTTTSTSIPEFVGPPAPPAKPVKPGVPPTTSSSTTTTTTSSTTTTSTSIPEFVGPPSPPAAPIQLGSSKSVKNQALWRVDTNGKLQNASSLMDRWSAYAGEAPFEINMACRKRFFGTSEMIELLDYLAQYLKSMRRDAKLFVSDIAKQSGGPLFRLNPHTCEDIPDNETLSHKAHRNGLDADISFVYLNPKTRFFSYKKRDQEVLAMKPELKNNFTAFRQNSVEYIRRTLDLKNQFSLLKHAVKTGSVELMFIYPSVKEALCGQAAQEGAFEKGKEDREAIETLRRLIPDYNVRDPEKVFQWGHGDHVHVRLKCDLKSHPNCVDPASMVPASHGCRISTKP